MMVGIGDQTMVKAVQLEPLPQEDVILTDARDLDLGERILVEKSKISFLTRPNDLIKGFGRNLSFCYDGAILSQHSYG